MFANAPGVPAAPPTSGLVASSVRPDINRWEQGLSWVPERCGVSYQLVPWCDEPAAGFDAPRPGAAYYRPVGLRVADECSTMSGPVDMERVRRVAEAAAPFAVARELWSGDLAQLDPHTVSGEERTNAYLASDAAEVVGAAAASALVGFGRLEQAAMEAAGGQHVMLHAPVALLPLLSDCFRHVGQTLLTHAGNVLVADPGYPGTGPEGQPAGATQWVYATAPVAVLMSPVVVDDHEAHNVAATSNTRTVWTSRVVAALFDPCVHLATELTVA